MILLFLLLTEGSEVEICCPFDINDMCRVDRTLPEGLSLTSDCKITGITKSTLKSKEFTLSSFRNGEIVEKKTFTLGVYVKLDKCNYNEGLESVVFPENATSSLTPPKCNTEVEKCYSSTELPNSVRVNEDGSILLENPAKAVLNVDVICMNKVSEYKLKLKIIISGNSKKTDNKPLHRSLVDKMIEKNDKIRNLQSNIIRSTWEYTDKRMTFEMWMVSNDKEGWIKSNSFPPKSVITRYYRNSFTISSIRETGSPILKITFDDGIIVYINGKEIYRRNLPHGEVDQKTTAIKSEKRSIQIVIPLISMKEGINHIAMEIRSFTLNPYRQLDSFTCILSLTSRITSTPTQISTADTITQSYSYPNTDKKINSIKNNDTIYEMDDKYVEYWLESQVGSYTESDWFPFNITYTFKNNKAYYFNQFSISGCSDNADYHPKNVKIYGTTDSENPNWELFFKSQDLGLTGEKCTTKSSYSLPVEKSYESYKLEIVKINSHPNYDSIYIKFKLFITSIKLSPICDKDSSEFPSIYAGGTSISECFIGFKKRECIYESSTNTARWSDEIDISNCYNEDVYVSTYPGITKTYEFDKEISYISPQSQSVSIDGKTLTVNSNSEIIKKFEVTLIDQVVKNVYVSVLRDVGKCSYGVDYLSIYPVEFDLELRCDNRPSNITVKNLPAGLSVDENGRITGMISDGIKNKNYTTIITYIIDKKYDLELKWHNVSFLFNEGLELDYFGVAGQDGMNDNGNHFYDAPLKDIWEKFDNGSYTLQPEKYVIKSSSISISDANGYCSYNDWRPCQNGLARLRGYIRVDEPGQYTFYGQSESQKFALRNYEDQLYSTIGWHQEGNYTVELKKGYYVIGYLTWYGAKNNSFLASWAKAGGEKTLLNGRMFSGGFVISHLSYNTLYVEIYKNKKISIKPSYNGIPSKWKITPKIDGLSIRTDGTIDIYMDFLHGYYQLITIKSINDIDLCQASTELQLHYDDIYLGDFNNGLIVKYYTSNSVDINNSIDISAIEDKDLRLERIEEKIYHELSDNLWDGLPEELSYSFIAVYKGLFYTYNVIFLQSNIVVYLECYDYCKLTVKELDLEIECKGYGYHKESKKIIRVPYGRYDMEIIYAKGNLDKTKLLKIYYSKTDVPETVMPDSSYCFNPAYPIVYNPIKTHYYKDEFILIKSPFKAIKFVEDITYAKYSIVSALPPGLSLHQAYGYIRGTAKAIDDDRNYTVRIDLSDGYHYYTSFAFSILPKIEPVIEYSVTTISKKVGERIEISPSEMKCDYIKAVYVPYGLKIDNRGVIKGIPEVEYDNDVEINCYTYKMRYIKIHMVIESDGTIPPTTQTPTTVKPTDDIPTTIKPTGDIPTTVIPTGDNPTTITPANKVVELYFTININIKTLTKNDINIIKESLIVILKQQNINMTITEIDIENVDGEMRILSEYTLKVTIKTLSTESSKTSLAIEYLSENENELEKEIKSRSNKLSDIYNCTIEIIPEKDDSSSPEDGSSSSSLIIIVVVVVVIIIIIIIALIIICIARHRKTVRRSADGKQNGKTNVRL